MKKFLYYILKPDGRSAKVVNGVVTYTGVPTPLPQTPEGWQDLLLQFERSTTKHGLSPKVSLPLGFVLNGAKIVRDAIYKESIEAKLQLLIQKLELDISPTNYKHIYKYFFRADIDLINAKDSQDIVNVPLVEGDLSKLIEANYDTVYDIPIDEDAVNVIMDGVEKEYSGSFIINDQQEIPGTSNPFMGVEPAGYDGVVSGVSLQSVSSGNSGIYPNNNYFLTSSFSKTFLIEGTITLYMNKSVTPTIRLELNDGIGGGVTQTTLYNTAASMGEIITIPVSQSFTLLPGYRAHIKCSGGSGVDPTAQYTITGTDLKVTYQHRFKQTNVQGFDNFTLFKKVVKKITGQDVAVSNLLTDNGIVITSGDAIRGIAGSVISTSLSNIFKDADATFMAGIAVSRDAVEIESRLNYYDETEVTDLGTVTDFEVQPAKEFMANTFKFGHKQQQVEDLNGKYDPNGANLFTGSRGEQKEYTQVSPFKASPIEIEDLRINLEGKTSTDADNNKDNDVYKLSVLPQPDLVADATFYAFSGSIQIATTQEFAAGQQIRITGSASNDGIFDVTSVSTFLGDRLIFVSQAVTDEALINVTIEVLRGAVYTLNRPSYSTLEGVPNNTIFNLPLLTPKTMLLSHGRWLASMSYGVPNEKIKFSSGKENKNVALKTILSGVTIDEDRDENVSDLGLPIFQPFYFVFKTEVPVNLSELLEENPNRCFKFTDIYGNEWKGFIKMAGIAPNDYTPQEFKLLSAASNDLTKLAR